MSFLIILGTFAAVLAYVFFGDKTFYLDRNELVSLLSSVKEADILKVYDFRLGVIPALLGGPQFYNGITQVECKDRNGQRYRVSVGKRAGIRIIRNSGKRQTFYLDTMFMRNNMVYGNKTHFANIPINPIPLEDITKIEIQFGPSRKTKIS